MDASVGLLLEVGIETIRHTLRAVTNPILAWAASAGIRVASPLDRHASAIVCLELPDPLRLTGRSRRRVSWRRFGRACSGSVPIFTTRRPS